ncbi:CIA30 family protein [Emericellopsis atlantica]|uniref:CIA30 family protein n=1 Tax=Emericellopsis atlantica TaxID=2614577 RepID=A0A9P8CQG6_9HYPO|nr:CIA30 family protein [Emericellopsis atlantica]KAG9253726.1 CIA30 family protein [Emericellopsis atlantica]
MQKQTSLDLFGGDRPWDASLWETTDDRVRGGSSVSHLTVHDGKAARFHGTLDTSTLGGAGFASQQTRGTNHWDLSRYEGLLLRLGEGDGKRYVITLKDEIPGRRPDGRMESGVSWEAEFTSSEAGATEVWLPWGQFKATYRGRPKDDAKPLDTADVKRVGLMMRSFFDSQHGDFAITLRSITATSSSSGQDAGAACDHHANESGQDDDGDEEDELARYKQDARTRRHSSTEARQTGATSWWRGVFCGLL